MPKVTNIRILITEGEEEWVTTVIARSLINGSHTLFDMGDKVGKIECIVCVTKPTSEKWDGIQDIVEYVRKTKMESRESK